jgi:DNA-binding transcriptional ArsR family regulator
MALNQKRVEDLETLRAFVHPLRIRLLGALRVDGPATASELARRFDESSGATSYHLRQLARYGFVEDDGEQPSRRERRWRASHELTSWDTADFVGEPAGRSALRVLARERIGWIVDQLQRWYAERKDWPLPWVSAAQDSDLLLRMRADDLAALSKEMWDVVSRYADQQRSPDDPEAERVVIYLHAFPAKDVIL